MNGWMEVTLDLESYQISAVSCFVHIIFHLLHHHPDDDSSYPHSLLAQHSLERRRRGTSILRHAVELVAMYLQDKFSPLLRRPMTLDGWTVLSLGVSFLL